MCAPQEPPSAHTTISTTPTQVEPESSGFINASTILPVATAFTVIYYIFKCIFRCIIRMFVRRLQMRQNEKAKEEITAIGKTALVTSATTAVGMVAVRELNTRGAIVYMLCRTLERGQEARRELNELGCDSTRLILKIIDLEDFIAVRKFAKDFEKEVDRLDILINNSDLMFRPESDIVSASEHKRELGLFLLTELMFPLLRKSKQGRVVVVSSGLSDEEFAASRKLNRTQSTASYQRTHQANVMYVRELRRRLRKEGAYSVMVNACHSDTLYKDVCGNVLVNTSLFSRMRRSLMWFCTKIIADGFQASIYAAVSHTIASFSKKLFTRSNKNKPYIPDASVSRYLYEENMKAVGLKASTDD